MRRSHLRLASAAAVAICLLPAAQSTAVIYSPTQAELDSVEFIDFWPGNGATLTMKELVDSDGVKYTFDTGYATPTPDNFSRTQFETPAGVFTQDLNGFDAFSIDFLANASADPLTAQVYLRWEGGGFAAASSGINQATRTSVSIPIGAVPAASRDQITAFGIEIFSNNIFTPESGAMASAFTSPQPPEFEEFVIWSFEGADGNGSTEGWGPAFEPDHLEHNVATFGATHGDHSLEIVRQRTGEVFGGAGTSFRWGSQGVLDASAGGGENPFGDYNNDGSVDAADYSYWRDRLGSSTELGNSAIGGPASAAHFDEWKSGFGATGGGDNGTQARIDQIVDAINGGDELAFDVSFENVDQFPLAQPGFLGFHAAITDGSGGFWQSDDFGFPAIPNVGEAYEGLTLTVPLSSFTDRSANAFGDLSTGALTAENGIFTMILASNTGVTGDAMDQSMYTISIHIDNIRVRTIIPQNALAAGVAGVPEPAAASLAFLGATIGLMLSRPGRKR